MREIKFRGWDRELKVMVYSNELTGGIEYDCNPVRTLNIILNEDELGFDYMQFTGLHDKNGKEIYEGDILFVEIYGNLGDISEEECFNAKIVWLDNAFHLVDSEGDTWTEWLTTYQGKDVKIIGNIYENPELLNNEQ